MRKILATITLVGVLGGSLAASAAQRQRNYTAFKTSDHSSRITEVLVRRHCLRTEDGAGALKLVDYEPSAGIARYRCPH